MEGVRGAGDAAAAGVADDVGVDHGRLDVFMTEEILDRADVVTGHEQMRRETVPECMGADLFRNVGVPRGLFDRALDHRFVQVVASLAA